MCVSEHVCVSESVYIFDHHSHIYVTDLKCLALVNMNRLLGICVFICGTFVAFNPHNAYLQLELFVCLPSYH